MSDYPKHVPATDGLTFPAYERHEYPKWVKFAEDGVERIVGGIEDEMKALGLPMPGGEPAQEPEPAVEHVEPESSEAPAAEPEVAP